MDIFSAITNYWLDEFIVVLVASVVSIVIVEQISEHRRKAKVRISPYALDKRIGFKVDVWGGTLYSPKIIYNIPENEGDNFPCDIYDAYGNLWKRDYVLAGEAFCVFPLLAESEWKKGEDGLFILQMTVKETNYSGFERDWLWFRPVIRPDGRISGLTLLESSDYPETRFDVALRVYAQGWSDDEVHLFGLEVQPHAWHQPYWDSLDSSVDLPHPPVEKWDIYYEVFDRGPKKKGSRRLDIPR